MLVAFSFRCSAVWPLALPLLYSFVRYNKERLMSNMKKLQTSSISWNMSSNTDQNHVQDANAALSADCEQKVAEAARLQAVNSRLQGENDKLRDEVSV
jgi:hypothetical protein